MVENLRADFLFLTPSVNSVDSSPGQTVCLGEGAFWHPRRIASLPEGGGTALAVTEGVNSALPYSLCLLSVLVGYGEDNRRKYNVRAYIISVYVYICILKCCIHTVCIYC